MADDTKENESYKLPDKTILAGIGGGVAGGLAGTTAHSAGGGWIARLTAATIGGIIGGAGGYIAGDINEKQFSSLLKNRNELKQSNETLTKQNEAYTTLVAASRTPGETRGK